MITVAGKYADVRAGMPVSGEGLGAGQSRGRRPASEFKVQGSRFKVPAGAVQTFGQSNAAGRRAVPFPSPRPSPLGRGGPASAGSSGSGGLQILVPKAGALVRMDEWFWKEMREGGFFRRYLEREKGMAKARVRRVGKVMEGVRTGGKQTEDLELKAAIPARDFFRWKKEDKDFWRDDGNLRRLKRDNPELCIYNV